MRKKKLRLPGNKYEKQFWQQKKIVAGNNETYRNQNDKYVIGETLMCLYETKRKSNFCLRYDR